MSFWQGVKREIRELAITGSYFIAWIGSLMLLKTLILAEYHVEFREWSLVLVGALVLAKVVLVLEHVPLWHWARHRPAWMEVVLRTLFYSAGVFVVLVIEKAFEGRQAHGGFGAALVAQFQSVDGPRVWANTICLAGALLGFNVLAVIQRHLGEGKLFRMFLVPLPAVEGGDGPDV